MRARGLEPPPPYGDQDLNLARLPNSATLANTFLLISQSLILLHLPDRLNTKQLT